MGYLTTLFRSRKVKVQPTFEKEQPSSTHAAGAIAIMPKLVSVYMLVVSEYSVDWSLTAYCKPCFYIVTGVLLWSIAAQICHKIRLLNCW